MSNFFWLVVKNRKMVLLASSRKLQFCCLSISLFGSSPYAHNSLVLITLCISVARYIIVFVVYKLRTFDVHIPNFHINLSTWRGVGALSSHTPSWRPWYGQKHRAQRHWPAADKKRIWSFGHIYYMVIDHVKQLFMPACTINKGKGSV